MSKYRKQAEYYISKNLKETQEHYTKMLGSRNSVELDNTYHDAMEALDRVYLLHYGEIGKLETEFLVGLQKEIDRGFLETAGKIHSRGK